MNKRVAPYRRSNQQPTEKLQKLLARKLGISRRNAEVLIYEERVEVDGKVAQIGARISSKQSVKFDDQIISNYSKQDSVPYLLLLNKPVGYEVSANIESGRDSVFSLLPSMPRDAESQRWLNIGRLDINTSGLLLFSDDGDICHKLTHPSFGWQRTYLARVGGLLTEAQLEFASKKGFWLDGQYRKLTELSLASTGGANHCYRMSICEGRNRIVRKFFEAHGQMVSRLIRIRYGPFSLPRELKVGDYEYLRIPDVLQ